MMSSKLWSFSDLQLLKTWMLFSKTVGVKLRILNRYSIIIDNHSIPTSMANPHVVMPCVSIVSRDQESVITINEPNSWPIIVNNHSLSRRPSRHFPTTVHWVSIINSDLFSIPFLNENIRSTSRIISNPLQENCHCERVSTNFQVSYFILLSRTKRILLTKGRAFLSGFIACWIYFLKERL